MKKITFFFLIIILCSFSGNQYLLVKSIPLDANYITTDKIGNCYVVSENNQVTKYTNQGVAEYNFSNKNMGKLKCVDATNPMKILLFYSDFNQITILDNKLALRTQITLRELNILQPLLVCTSVNEGMWIFDQQDFQLKRLDMNLRIVQESGNIIQTTGAKIQPIQLIEADGRLFLNNPETGILIFDLFGTYYKTIPIKHVSSIQVVEENLLYFKDQHLESYHLKTLEEKIIELPEKTDSLTLTIRMEQQKIFLLKKRQLNIYSIL